MTSITSRTSLSRSLGLVAALALAGVTFSPRMAHAQNLFFSGSTGEFGTLNVTTGATVRLGSTTYNGTTIYLGGLANSSNGNLYGLESNIYQDAQAATVLRLFQVNRTSGALSLVGAVSTFTNTSRAGYAQIGNTSDGTLYATYSPSLFGTNQSLYTLNASSAVATQVGTGTTGFKFDGGIVGDGSGNLVGFAGIDYGNADYSISRTSGAATQLQSNAGGGNVGAAGFTNGSVYALNSNGNIYTLNAGTGALVTTGQSYNTSTVSLILGAANVTPITAAAAPEPGSIALLALAGLPAVGVISARRRRAAKSA